jgi:VWFA-related protein
MTRAGQDVPIEGTLHVKPDDGTVVRTRFKMRNFADVEASPEQQAPAQRAPDNPASNNGGREAINRSVPTQSIRIDKMESEADIEVTYAKPPGIDLWFPGVDDGALSGPDQGQGHARDGPRHDTREVLRLQAVQHLDQDRSVTTMRRLIGIVLVLAVTQAAAQQPSPTFRAGIDVLTIEAAVLDRDGKPIIDLTPADFYVTLDGKPRRVRDARFYGDGGAEVVARAESTVSGPVMNSSEDGRIVVFVVDRDSIAPGNEQVVLEAATTVIDGLSPADAAGVLSLPGDSTDLTRNHVLVRMALSRLTGARPRIPQSRDYNITWDEALGYERRDPLTIARVIERECPNVKQPNEFMRNPCPPELESYAREFLLTGRFRTQSVLTNLSSLAKQLAPMRGPKQIVFLSGGFPFGQDLLPLYNQFAAQAAEASNRVLCGSPRRRRGGRDDRGSSARQPRTAAATSQGGMGTVATMTGGAFFSAGGSAAGIFNRVRTEMNNFYELAVRWRATTSPPTRSRSK